MKTSHPVCDRGPEVDERMTGCGNEAGSCTYRSFVEGRSSAFLLIDPLEAVHAAKVP